MNLLLNLLLRMRSALVGRLLWQPFIQQTRNPTETQERLLRSILQRQQTTRFGREHHFAEIRTAAEYSARVPIQQYEDLRPYIEQQEESKSLELLVQQPILYARTSGTTGKPKYIPILAETIAGYRRSQQLFSYCQYSAIPGVFSGKTLAFVSPAVEGRLPTGTPYGSMSGLIYDSMPWLLRHKYVVPSAVFECLDHELKYLLIAIFASAERSITCMASANPSTFLKIAKVIQSQARAIVAAVATGDLPGQGILDPEIYRELHATFRKNPRRADELRILFASGAEVTFAMLWPGLKAAFCWREGSCRVLLPAIQRQLPPIAPILEMGYLASECRGSIPVDSRRCLEVPTIHENYFEFIERNDWESGRSRVQTVGQLETGQAYYVVITTQAGLYRYFMNDIVVVDGKFHGTPTIKFLEKGAGATNITGEKLYESQVSEAVETLLRDRQCDTPFFVVVADPERQRYRFYIEARPGDITAFAEALDREISARNLEYKSKRESGRLHQIELQVLRLGAGEAYKAHLVAQGQREAQFKFVRLQSRAKLTFDFETQLASRS
jgi:hypothetical protein